MKRKTKDRIGNIAGLVFALSGALAGAGAAGVQLPSEITSGAVILTLLSGAVIGWLTGKPSTP